MKKEIEPYSLWWLPAGKDNRYYLFPDDYYDHVPWFTWGENLKQFKAGVKGLNEECLLKGILYGLSPSTTIVGGIFFDNITDFSLEDSVKMLESVANSYLNSYKNIIEKRV